MWWVWSTYLSFSESNFSAANALSREPYLCIESWLREALTKFSTLVSRSGLTSKVWDARLEKALWMSGSRLLVTRMCSHVAGKHSSSPRIANNCDLISKEHLSRASNTRYKSRLERSTMFVSTAINSVLVSLLPRGPCFVHKSCMVLGRG